jgi:hypothetical protein
MRPQLPKITGIVLAVRVGKECQRGFNRSECVSDRIAIPFSPPIGEESNLLLRGEFAKDSIGSIRAPIFTNEEIRTGRSGDLLSIFTDHSLDGVRFIVCGHQDG